MTPYELAKSIHEEISDIAPKLSAALNRALIDIGEGSKLYGLGPGTHESENRSFQEYEKISVELRDPAIILSKITSSMSKLEDHSSWKVLVDRKQSKDKNYLELLYVIYRTDD